MTRGWIWPGVVLASATGLTTLVAASRIGHLRVLQTDLVLKPPTIALLTMMSVGCGAVVSLLLAVLWRRYGPRVWLSAGLAVTATAFVGYLLATSLNTTAMEPASFFVTRTVWTWFVSDLFSAIIFLVIMAAFTLIFDVVIMTVSAVALSVLPFAVLVGMPALASLGGTLVGWLLLRIGCRGSSRPSPRT